MWSGCSLLKLLMLDAMIPTVVTLQRRRMLHSDVARKHTSRPSLIIVDRKFNIKRLDSLVAVGTTVHNAPRHANTIGRTKARTSQPAFLHYSFASPRIRMPCRSSSNTSRFGLLVWSVTHFASGLGYEIVVVEPQNTSRIQEPKWREHGNRFRQIVPRNSIFSDHDVPYSAGTTSNALKSHLWSWSLPLCSPNRTIALLED